MLFNSFEFIILVLATFIIYYLPICKKIQVYILILASLAFYTFHNPILLALLLSSIFINVVASYLIVHSQKNKSKRIYSILGVILNLGILAFFKYSPLIGVSFFSSHSSIGEFLVSIPLPVGISFFTFQGISLVVDTFKHEKANEYQSLIPRQFALHSFRTALFISFFPQLVAGPIVKAHDFLPQIKTKTFKDINWEKVFKDIVIGYFLKMVIADNLKDQTFWISYPYFEYFSSLSLSGLLFGYSMQIFADFAGYSLIAIGISGLFGYNLHDNFLYPYISTSLSEFWRRWHISLSSFLKEYLYIPLGGNRKGKFRTYINLMITMVLGGLWHGAAWSYAVWGTYHGVFLAIERLLKDHISIRNTVFIQIIKGLFIFSFVTLGWLLFKLPEFGHVIKYVYALVGNLSPSVNLEVITHVAIYSVPVICYHLYYLLKPRLQNLNIYKFEPIIYGFMIFSIMTNSGSANEFIYFQF